MLLVVIGVHWLLLVVISVHYWWALVLVICHHRILVVIGVEGVSLLSIATLNRRQNHAITLRKETKNIVVDENNQCTLIADLTLWCAEQINKMKMIILDLNHSGGFHNCSYNVRNLRRPNLKPN